MTDLDDTTIANMQAALDKACQCFPNGGDHESRKYIAGKLIESAENGNTTLGGLDVVAHDALLELTSRKSA
jgi:hypothetical protein